MYEVSLKDDLTYGVDSLIKVHIDCIAFVKELETRDLQNNSRMAKGE